MLEWTTDATFRVDDTEYVCHPFGGVPSTVERFCICKSRPEVEAYERLLLELAPRRILEMGVKEGGSTAFFTQVARPEKMIAVDLRQPTSTALEEFIERNDLREVVKPYFGIDQMDQARVREIVDRELGPHDLDLVVDDASHRLEQTRRTFNVLFPRLRPGGRYLIEDWSTMFLLPDQQPLTVLVLELMMMCVEHSAIEDVLVDNNTVQVRRGEGALDPVTFDVAEHVGEHGRRLLTNL